MKYLNEIIQGDCLELMKELPKNSIDMILADLPYGITSNHWDIPIPAEPMWKQYKRLIKEKGVICLFASQPFSSILVSSNLKMFKHEWVWIKNRGSNFANTVREPMKEHLSILVFANKQWTYNKQMQSRTGTGLERAKYNVKFQSKSSNYRKFEGRLANRIPKLRVPSSWQKFNIEVGLHPTQKPVTLCEYLIRTYTNEGNVVLDNVVGSGTTAVAAKNVGRNFIGFEISEEYCGVARKRLEES